jgi:succinylarginine dihydrolase
VPEANFDGIVGPTHNYAGLSLGNVASASNRGAVARPREAALQGLAKAAALARLGLVQGWIPPQERPHVPTLRALGFDGSDEVAIARAGADAPHLLARASSASAMWTANAATVTPSADSGDGRVHMTIANLRAMPHRAIEPPQTAAILRAIFRDPARFAVHDALPATDAAGAPGPYGDEGAANHTRLTADERAGGEVPGVHLFVFGMQASGAGRRPTRYPARQTLEASQAIARMHGIPAERCVFAQQHPAAIDQGVFHNDVIAVGNGNLLLVHELALLDQARTLDDLAAAVGPGLAVEVVPESEVSVADAVRTYLFNSQLVTLPAGGMALILPKESEGHPGVVRLVERMVGDPRSPLESAIWIDVRESMRNGGGPACLRLRVPLTDAEVAAVAPGCLWSPERHAALESWVRRHYREELAPADLADPQLLRESRTALDELTRLLGIGPVYEFQQ